MISSDERGFSRVHHQDRHRPPVAERRRRHDEPVHAQFDRAEIEPKARESDDREQRHATQDVLPRSVPGEADRTDALARATYQVHHEEDRG